MQVLGLDRVARLRYGSIPAVFGFVEHKQPAYDPKKISGFAFGMGVDRIAMMKYGISDIGLFYSGDARFLEQFA